MKVSEPDAIKTRRRESKEVLGAAVKKLRSVAKAYGRTDHAMGLDQAADILEEGDF